MKFWIVGKDGLLGKELTHYFDENQIPYVASSHQEADILNKDELSNFFHIHHPTHIINAAAYTNVDDAEDIGRDLNYKINCEGPKNLTELSQNFGIRLIHISTDYVFDGEKEEDYNENDITNPINEYGRAKLLGEIEVLKYEKSVSIRTASLYGRYKKGIVSSMIDHIKNSEEVSHFVDQISTPTNTKDLCSAIYDLRDESGVFHFVNEGSVSRYGLMLHLYELALEFNLNIKCQKVVAKSQKDAKRKAIRPQRSVLSTNKIKSYLNKPIRTWQEAVREYFKSVC
jgi:dTDP-4-dehydrorhamnose reductase